MIKKLFSNLSSFKSKNNTMGNSSSTNSNNTDGKGGTIQQKITPIFDWKNKKEFDLFIEYELGSNIYTCCYSQLTEIPTKIFTSKIKSSNGAFTNSEDDQQDESSDSEKSNSSKVVVPEENPYLETLILDFNKITEITSNLTLLVNLKNLSLASNQITEIPDFIASFKYLDTLQVGLNPLISFPTIVCTITTLTVLHLESNQLSSLPDEFINLVNLKVLSLMDNLLKTIPSSLPKGIEKLNLACNDIESTESESIERLGESLETFNLSENQITIISKSFSKLVKLKTLILDCNHIKEIPGDVIEGMESLVTFNIPHNNISTVPPEIIKLHFIKVIDIRGNPFDIIKTKPKEMSSSSAFDIEDFILDKENLTRIQLDQLEVIINTPDNNNNENSNNIEEIEKLKKDNKKIIFWQSTSPDEIVENLYLGCRECSINKTWLKENNVTHILTVAHFKPLYPTLFKYKCINIDDVDSEDIAQYFKEIVDFIEEGRKQGGVLVHCRAGVSRSATSVIAYLMTKFNITYQEAFNQTSQARSRVCPNLGFTHQLKNYESTLPLNGKK